MCFHKVPDLYKPQTHTVKIRLFTRQLRLSLQAPGSYEESVSLLLPLLSSAAQEGSPLTGSRKALYSARSPRLSYCLLALRLLGTLRPGSQGAGGPELIPKAICGHSPGSHPQGKPSGFQKGGWGRGGLLTLSIQRGDGSSLFAGGRGA